MSVDIRIVLVHSSVDMHLPFVFFFLQVYTYEVYHRANCVPSVGAHTYVHHKSEWYAFCCTGQSFTVFYFLRFHVASSRYNSRGVLKTRQTGLRFFSRVLLAGITPRIVSDMIASLLLPFVHGSEYVVP